jgi:ComF family protein
MGIIIDWVFPKKCLGCGKIGFYLCLKCRGNIKSRGVDYKDKRLEGKIGLFKYDGAVRELIRTIKFEFVSGAISEAGNWMAMVLKKDYPNVVMDWKKEKYVIVPVPLYWRRENWRGFNQSAEMAKVIGNILKLKVIEGLIIRTKNTKSQSTQQKNFRRTNVEGAFKIMGKIPRKIIILDDVWTSGATIKSMIKILPKKTKIWVLTLGSGR